MIMVSILEIMAEISLTLVASLQQFAELKAFGID
jgi:hypothetical protein